MRIVGSIDLSLIPLEVARKILATRGYLTRQEVADLRQRYELHELGDDALRQHVHAHIDGTFRCRRGRPNILIVEKLGHDVDLVLDYMIAMHEQKQADRANASQPASRRNVKQAPRFERVRQRLAEAYRQEKKASSLASAPG